VGQDVVYLVVYSAEVTHLLNVLPK